ncbi:MAG: methylated-DNA--[protein]-cysteine S-methyltransferase [Pseudomonadota bacterium]
MRKFQLKIATKIGPLYLVGTAQALHGVFWKKQNMEMVSAEHALETNLLKTAEQQLIEYLDGKRKTFTLPLQAEGTPFQQRVWKELMKIPYGQTRAYKDIATAIENAKACRAVGTANGQNPLSIIVPCHRVIAADGTLGGYAGSVPIKKMLLDIEQDQIS